MTNTTFNLVNFGVETLKYEKDFQADNYFRKKFNEFWKLDESNNTGTYQEIMTFAKAKASKKSKLMDWYEQELSTLLKDVFTDSVAEVERESYERVVEKKKSTPKKKKEIDNKEVSEAETTKTDEEILKDLI